MLNANTDLTDFSQFAPLATLNKAGKEDCNGRCFAYIGLWVLKQNEAQEDNARYVCEGTVRIYDALFLKPNVPAHNAPYKQFLHLSEEKDKIYYFTQDQHNGNAVEMFYLNLDRI